MSEQDNVQVVERAYGAFQRGDIPGLLETMSEGVEWFTPGASEAIPYAGRRIGHDKLREFFAVLDESEQITHFEPQEFISQGDKVVVLGNYKGRVIATNKAFDLDWLHVFTVRDGKVAQFREYVDTAALAECYRDAGAQTASA